MLVGALRGGTIETDLVGQVLRDIKGVDGKPARLIKPINITPLCPGAKRDSFDAIVGYARSREGIVVVLEEERLDREVRGHWPLAELSAEKVCRHPDFCTWAKRWGVGALDLAKFAYDNAPASESRG